MHNKQLKDLLFERIRDILLVKGISWEEKRMMGGLTFMIDDKMCFGTFKGGLLCRVSPQERDHLLKEPAVDIVRQGNREMKGYVLVQPSGFESDQELEFWITKCLEFNPFAKSSKK